MLFDAKNPQPAHVGDHHTPIVLVEGDVEKAGTPDTASQRRHPRLGYKGHQAMPVHMLISPQKRVWFDCSLFLYC